MQSFLAARGMTMKPRSLKRFSICAFSIFAMSACTMVAPGTSSTGWTTYNGGYSSQRYSPLDSINTGNVAGLKPLCEVQLGEEGAFESGPIVVGDVLYVTTAHTTLAINAANCGVLWRDVYHPAETEVFQVNRGAAYLDGRLFRGYADGRLAALDASTGKRLWTVKAGDPSVGEFLSSAPIAWDGLVFVGLAGSDWGIRGQMMAFDAATGQEHWHFYTIPSGNEPGADTWSLPATVRHGGGGMWTSYTLDPQTGELFVPVGNPSPDFDPAHRPGDNLFTDSVVVLDAHSGKLLWWYQLVHHDGLDWDLGAAPVLFAGQQGNRVALGSKDGLLYALDRGTHQLVFKTPVTTIDNADAKPTLEGVHVCPGALGGVEWNGPAYDPRTGSLYVGAVDWCQVYKRALSYDYVPGEMYMGTSAAPNPSDSSGGWVTAVDADSGKVRWSFHAPTPVVAGVTPTAGGVVFTGDIGGDFYAFDAQDGKVLLKFASGGSMAGGVVTYAVQGRQYVAFASGNVSRLGTFNTSGSPTLVVMTLGVEASGPVRVVLPDAGVALTQAGTQGESPGPGQGQQVFGAFCSGCHGNHGEGGVGPSLQDEGTRKDLAAVVAWIKDPTPPMPKLYPKPLSDADVQAVAVFVETLKKP